MLTLEKTDYFYRGFFTKVTCTFLREEKLLEKNTFQPKNDIILNFIDQNNVDIF